MDEITRCFRTQFAVGLILLIVVTAVGTVIKVGEVIYDTIMELIDGEEEKPTDTNRDKPNLYKEHEVYICFDDATKKAETI